MQIFLTYVEILRMFVLKNKKESNNNVTELINSRVYFYIKKSEMYVNQEWNPK
jgi:hypothetical protein